jgi:uncharacterized protein (TIGR02284 family)
METISKELIKGLNDLVEINNDRVEGYEKASGETNDSDLKSLFNKMASHSREFRKELSAEIIRMGETPTQGTRTSGKFYRAWMDIKAALTAKDRKAILASCEFGEDAALDAYDEVLKNHDEITSSIREIIRKQRDEIQKDHNAVKALRDINR